MLDTQNKCLSGCVDEEEELSVCEEHDGDELQAGLRIDIIVQISQLPVTQFSGTG